MPKQKKKLDPPRRMPIRKGDIVVVVAGAEEDKFDRQRNPVQRRVLRTYPRTGYLVVEGARIRHRHTKPNAQAGVKGGVVDKEGIIHVSNVKLISRPQRERRAAPSREAKGEAGETSAEA